MGDTDMNGGICITLLTVLLSSPQTPFDGISIGDDFDVRLVCGVSQSVDTDETEDISKFIVCKIENSILKLEFDRKNASKALKISDKHPLKITIATDKPVTSIRIGGKSVVSSQAGSIGGKDVSISAADQSRISSICVSNTERTSIILERKTDATISVTTNSLMVATDGNAILDIDQKSDRCTIDAKGTSSVVLRGETSSIDVASNGNAKLILNGKTHDALFDCHGSSATNASNLECTGCAVLTMSGACSLSVGTTESLHIKNMNSGSSLDFYGNPAISIGEIKSSSIKHLSQD